SQQPFDLLLDHGRRSGASSGGVREQLELRLLSSQRPGQVHLHQHLQRLLRAVITCFDNLWKVAKMNKLIAISVLVLGFGGGAWWGYHAGSTDSPETVAHAGIPSLVMREPGLAAGRAADADPSQMRALIREEMAAVLAARSGGSAATPTPVKTPASPEQQAE